MLPPKRRTFFSFHYKNDVMRTMQVRNIGRLGGNQPVSPNDWEEVKRGGVASVKRWIDGQMYGRSVAIVLVGTVTYARPWVRYEIQQAWEKKMGVLGIYIHGLKDPRAGTCPKGKNPFNGIIVRTGEKPLIGAPLVVRTSLHKIVRVHTPQARTGMFGGTITVKDIENNITDWIEEAIEIRRRHV